MTVSSRETEKMEFFATCVAGLESILADELRGMGLKSVRPLTGGVAFFGELSEAYVALLWSRVASRVHLVVCRIDAKDADSLYANIKELPWENHIDAGGTIAITSRGSNENLRDTRYTSLRVKDAICDRLREHCGQRPNIDTETPDVLVHVSLRKHRMTVSIDLSGTSLENRGYRDAAQRRRGDIGETLAAAALIRAGWPQHATSGCILVNPFCKDAVMAIEASLMAADVAPRITRERWGFTSWLGHDDVLWNRILAEADERAQNADRRVFALMCDSPEELDRAFARLRSAGVSKCVACAESEQELASLMREYPGACFIAAANIMSQDVSVPANSPALYSSIAATIESLDALDACVLVSSDQDLGAFIHEYDVDTLKTKSGSTDCFLHTINCTCEHNAKTVSVRDKQVFVHDANSKQFADRLNKVFKRRGKWARQHDVRAYRVYDADLPDYNMAIDIYQGAASDCGKAFVHVAEYAPPAYIDTDKAARRMSDALRIIAAVFEISPECIFVKRRVRAKGGSQYGAFSEVQQEGSSPVGRLVTAENGILFQVDLARYLDTGLFLDHRDTRALLSKLVRGKGFLNLFAYTGSASVYAAAAGAKFTTSVDLSNTYLDWARQNMELNGLMNGHQEFVREDCIAWVKQMRHSKYRWDFIFIDPPTFSNSSKMAKRSWDVQRDHAELLIGASRLLTRNGAMMFSCNLRNFRLDAQTLAKAGVVAVDITHKTIPFDFERNPHIHHCYLLRRE